MTFSGFPKQAMGFWHELDAEMNKTWFEANKQRYQTEWVEPFTSLLADVAGALASTYKPIKLGAPRVMRIYRDVRFSKDKSPYKTWIGGGVSVGGDGKPSDGPVAIYAHFGVGEEFVGAGQYVFADADLAKWRKLVADKTKGPAVAKLVADLKKKRYAVHAYDALARVPKPYDPEHPRGDLLKMKGLVVGFPEVPKGLIFKPAFADWLVKHCKAAAPLSKWIHKNL